MSGFPVQRFVWKSIGIVEDMDIKPGKVTVISGGNKRGKSTLLAAIMGPLAGGKQVEILRQGAKKGLVGWEVEGEHGPFDVVKTFTPTGGNLKVTAKDGAEVPGPKTFLEKIYDAKAANPVAFMNAKPAERAQLMLEAFEVEAPLEELRAIVGEIQGRYEPDDAFAAITGVRQQVFSARTAVKGNAKRAKEIVEGLTDVAGLDANAIAEEGQMAEAALTNLKGQLQHQRDAAARAERDALDALEEEYRRRKQQIQDARTNAEDAARQEYDPLIQDATTEAAALRERLGEAQRAAGSIALRDQKRQEQREAEERSETLTGQIEAIDALRGKVLATIPVEGMDIQDDGEVYLGGIAFPQTALSERIDIALMVGSRRAGKGGILAVDDLEHLEPKTFRAFVEKALKMDQQWVFVRVTQGPLKIETDERVLASIDAEERAMAAVEQPE